MDRFIFHEKKVDYRNLLKENYFNELLALVTSEDVKRNEQRTVSILKEAYPLLSNYIESIFLWNVYPDDFNLWWDSSLQSGQVIKNEQALTFIIVKKEKDAENYKKDFFQNWLIIYAGGLGLHDMYSDSCRKTIRQGEIFITELGDLPKDNVKTEVLSKHFTHIYIWDKFSEIIYQILPYHKKIFDSGDNVA